jgi:hypothetical protein
MIAKRMIALLVTIAALAFGLTTPAYAWSVVAGDIIKLYDGPGTTGGGEFWVDVVGKGVSGTINGSNNDFITFCVEKNEYFSPGESLKVSAVNTAAVNGGVGGGNPDPLSPATAWLFTQFSSGTLAGYSHTSSKANSLQRAIWYLENEIAASDSGYAGDSQAQAWVAAALGSGWTGIGQVRVLNLLRKDSSGNYTIAAQDQLYIAPIPEPQAYATMLAGLALLGFWGARRRALHAG